MLMTRRNFHLQGPTLASNKIAMSRALGAAFLNHQVQQLEKTVSSAAVPGGSPSARGYGQHHSYRGGNGRGSAHGGAGAGGWRERERDREGARRVSPSFTQPGHAGGELWSPDQKPKTRTGPGAVGPVKGRRKEESVSVSVEGDRVEDRDRDRSRRKGGRVGQGAVAKDADVVVVDASVLVHALGQVKKWCRDGREEVVIVPLEGQSSSLRAFLFGHTDGDRRCLAALNTLDLLKKGTSALAQRARAASRILEAQVGTNPRIRVQQDDAFVLWDTIPFKESTRPANGANSGAAAAVGTSSEWVRRTICCARWEVEKGSGEHQTDAQAESEDGAEKRVDASSPNTKSSKPRIVLAISHSADEAPSASPPAPVSTGPTATSTSILSVPSPVPLPAPQPNRHEPRSAGTLVKLWAMRAGIELLEVAPSSGHGSGPNSSAGPTSGSGPTASAGAGNAGEGARDGRRSVEDIEQRDPRERERGGGKRGGGFGGSGSRGRRNSHARSNVGAGGGGGNSGGGGGGAMVERPPAVMAMMEMVAQPSRVVRVLARGEKLDP